VKEPSQVLKQTSKGENMDIKKNGKWIGALLLITTLVTVGIASSFAQSNKTCEQHERNAMNKLTEEQGEALQEKLQELRESDATPEEIREALQQFLEEMGIEMENCGMMKKFGHMKGFEDRPPMNHCFDQLTEEQREALREKMQELREDLQQFMKEMGIEMENCGMMKGFGRRGPMNGFGDEE